MPFRIDPDAAPLYKEIKPLHAQFKKAMKGKSAVHFLECLKTVFGSQFDRYNMTDSNHNEHEEISWCCPVPAKSIKAIFDLSVVIHLDDDSNFTQLVVNDKWIYGALLPLSLKMDLHSAWMEQLNHVTEMLNAKPSAKQSYFNVWDENTTLERLGLHMDNDTDGKQVVLLDSPAEALALRSAMGFLQTESARAMTVWPALAPWLNAMQTLEPAPNPLADSCNVELWQAWSNLLKGIYLQKNQQSTMALPDSFSLT